MAENLPCVPPVVNVEYAPTRSPVIGWLVYSAPTKWSVPLASQFPGGRDSSPEISDRIGRLSLSFARNNVPQGRRDRYFIGINEKNLSHFDFGRAVPPLRYEKKIRYNPLEATRIRRKTMEWNRRYHGGAVWLYLTCIILGQSVVHAGSCDRSPSPFGDNINCTLTSGKTVQFIAYDNNQTAWIGANTCNKSPCHVPIPAGTGPNHNLTFYATKNEIMETIVYNYQAPAVSSWTPVGSAGSLFSINGQYLNFPGVSITIGQNQCLNVNFSNGSMTCIIPTGVGRLLPVSLTANGQSIASSLQKGLGWEIYSSRPSQTEDNFNLVNSDPRVTQLFTGYTYTLSATSSTNGSDWYNAPANITSYAIVFTGVLYSPSTTTFSYSIGSVPQSLTCKASSGISNGVFNFQLSANQYYPLRIVFYMNTSSSWSINLTAFTNYVYLSNISSAAVFSYLAPTFSSIFPASNTQPTSQLTLTMNGTNIGDASYSPTLYVNGQSTAFQINNGSITFTPPSQGRFSLRYVTGGQSFQTDWTFLPPYINSSTTCPSTGCQCTLTGTSLGNVPGAIGVIYNGQRLNLSVSIPTDFSAVTFALPAGYRNASLQLIVSDLVGNIFNYAYSPANFTAITGLSTTLPGGNLVTISGGNFGPNTTYPISLTWGGVPIYNATLQSDYNGIQLYQPTVSRVGPVLVSLSIGGDVLTQNYVALPSIYNVAGPSQGTPSFSLNGTWGDTSSYNALLYIGNMTLPISPSSTTTFTFDLPPYPAGIYPMVFQLGNYNSTPANFTYIAAPLVTSVSLVPTIGGSSIILGNFLNYSYPSVTIGGTYVNVNSVSMTSITIMVPPGTGSTLLIVDVNGQSTTITFSYQPPTITDIFGNFNTTGGSINITGTNFGTDVSVIRVTLGGIDCPVISLPGAHTVMNVKIPPGSGSRTLFVQVDSQMSPAYVFTYSPPSLTSLTRNVPTSGGTVQVLGANFGRNLSLVNISLGGIPQNVSSVTDDLVSFYASPGTGFSLLFITVDGVTVTNTFTYAPPLILSAKIDDGMENLTLHCLNLGFNSSDTLVYINGSMSNASTNVSSFTTLVIPWNGALFATIYVNVSGQSSPPFNYTLGAPSLLALPTDLSTAGGSINVTGVNLGTAPTLDVSWADQLLTFDVYNTTVLSGTYPPGVGANLIFSVTIAGMSTSTTFGYAPPTISHYASSGDTSGSIVYVNGTNLGYDATTMTATLGGILCDGLVVDTNYSSVHFNAPPGVGSTDLRLTVGSGNPSATFTYNYSPPSLYNVTGNISTCNPIGFIQGVDLGPDTSRTQISVNGKPATLVTMVTGHTTLSFTAPSGTPNGTLVSVTVGGQSSNFVPFYYAPPSISSVTGPNSTQGGKMIILGYNLAAPGYTPTATVDTETIAAAINDLQCGSLRISIGAGVGTNHTITLHINNDVSINVSFSYPPPQFTVTLQNDPKSYGYLVISATNVGATNDLTTVYLDGAPVDSSLIISIAPGQIQIAAPNVPRVITIQVGGQRSSPYTYVPPPATVATYTSTITTQGGYIQLTGKYVYAPYDRINVILGGVTVSDFYAANDGTSLGIQIPPGTGSKLLVVSIYNATVYSNFIRYNPPTITGLVLNNLNTDGGRIYINGNDFGILAGDVTISVGGTPCGNVTMETVHHVMSVDVPPGVGVDLALTLNVSGQAIVFPFSYPAPTITSVGTVGTSGGELLVFGDNLGRNNLVVETDGAYLVRNNRTVAYLNVLAGTGVQHSLNITVGGQAISFTFSYARPTIYNVAIYSQNHLYVVVDGFNLGSLDQNVTKPILTFGTIPAEFIGVTTGSLLYQPPLSLSNGNYTLYIVVDGQSSSGYPFQWKTNKPILRSLPTNYTVIDVDRGIVTCQIGISVEDHVGTSDQSLSLTNNVTSLPSVYVADQITIYNVPTVVDGGKNITLTFNVTVDINRISPLGFISLRTTNAVNQSSDLVTIRLQLPNDVILELNKKNNSALNGTAIYNAINQLQSLYHNSSYFTISTPQFTMTIRGIKGQNTTSVAVNGSAAAVTIPQSSLSQLNITDAYVTLLSISKNPFGSLDPTPVHGGITAVQLSDPSGAEIPVEGLSTPIQIVIPLFSIPDNQSVLVCSYWNVNNSSWSGDGCTVGNVSATSLTCLCNHLTNFTVTASPRKSDNSGSPVSGGSTDDQTTTSQGDKTVIIAVAAAVGSFLFISLVVIIIILYVRSRRNANFIDIELTENVTTNNFDETNIVLDETLSIGKKTTVYRTIWGVTVTAVKMEDADDADLSREMARLKELHHIRIVQYLGAFKRENRLGLLLEFMPCGNLHTWTKTKVMYRGDILSIGRQVADGLVYLHALEWVHGAICAENILLALGVGHVTSRASLTFPQSGGNMVAKICDFGSMVRPGGKAEALCDAPEVKDSKKVEKGTDVFCLAVVIMWVHVMRRKSDVSRDMTHPIKCSTSLKTIEDAEKRTLPDDIDELMDRCWRPKPRDRPTAVEVYRALEAYKHEPMSMSSPKSNQRIIAIQLTGGRSLGELRTRKFGSVCLVTIYEMSGKKGKSKKEEVLDQVKDILQGLILADSFDNKFAPITKDAPRCLLPLMNIPLIEYTLEFLASVGVQQIFILCCAHADKIQQYISNSRWSRPGVVTVECVVSSDCSNVGEALREIYTMEKITNDFILVPGDLVSNMNLDHVIARHKARRQKEDKACIMTTVLKKAPPDHRSRSLQEDVVVGIDEKSSRLVYFDDDKESKELKVDLTVFEDLSEVTFRNDLIDCRIDVCSPEVLIEFTDNFDWQDLRQDFMRGILTSEIRQSTIYTHVISGEYAARVRTYGAYDVISQEIIHRWAYPFVPDNNFLSDTTYTYHRNGRYFEKDVKLSRGSIIGRNCTIGRNVQIVNSYVWDDVVIEDNCVIHHAILANYSKCYPSTVLHHGCILSFNVHVGPSIEISAHTVLVNEQRGKSTHEIELGSMGSGFSWKSPDSAPSGLASLRSSRAILPKQEDDDTRREYDDLFTSGEAEVVDEQEKFQSEAHDIISSGILEDISIDNIVLQLKGRKFAYNASFADCVVLILHTFLELHKTLKGNALLAAVNKTVEKYKELFEKFINNDEERVELLFGLQDFSEKPTTPAEFKSPAVYPMLVKALYDAEIVDEGNIEQWVSENEEGDPTVALARPFIEWLQQAEEEDEDEEDGSEEDE
ncbi:hypothetical protein PROFUN_04613 [Planoprotostelium fungivorum]|uniref:Translation initiation factor eIF2B subunit epsilon n=1 Tax=Planoprotostelium fungivorum TaxID=1890364 RepID=A0A2P6NUH0_9EUKA|nr:hypothetical protein PROFUN_04613 [Planoprotostelium fungivorum]